MEEWFTENLGIFLQAMVDRAKRGHKPFPFAPLRSLLMQLFDQNANL